MKCSMFPRPPAQRRRPRMIVVMAVAAVISPAAGHARADDGQPPRPAAKADVDRLLSDLSVSPHARAQAAFADAARLRGQAILAAGATTMEVVRSAAAILDNRLSAATPQERLASDGRHAVSRAILSAGRSTGVSAVYLWRTARRESGLDPTARAPGSSAEGLFQFLDETWLEVISRHGAKHGVRDAPRAQLLSLRRDAWTSARMAAELARDNRRVLERALGHAVREEDLYVAHFLGSADAVRLILAARRTPALAAVSLLPTAAKANRPVFYRHGRPLSCRELLERLRHG